MAFPTVRIEAAFTVDGAFGTALVLDNPTTGVLNTATLSEEVWTDITAYAQSVDVRRGASRAESPILRFEAGVMTITLDNSDRRFDPSNTAGPYVTLGGISQVTPMRQVRVLADYMGLTYPIFTGYADSWDISYDEPSVSWCVLTATDATKVLTSNDRAAVSTAVGEGEYAGQRVHRILNSAGWSPGLRDVDAGKSTLQATTLDGSAWDELQKVQDAEIGHVYVDGWGYVVFRDRLANMTDVGSTTVQAAFGDGVGELPFVDHTIEYDDQGLVNVARAAIAGGIMQSAEDVASQAQYLTHTFERSDLLLQTDTDAANYAAFILYQSKDPELRFTQLTVAGNDDEALWPHMLGRQFGDLITLTRRPPGGGPVTTRRCFIVGVTHSIPGPNEWRTTWTLQSATKWTFLTLDDATLGVLGSNAMAY